MKANISSGMYAVAEPARRKLAQAFYKRAAGKRFTPAERAEFGRMAEAWQKTLPKKKHKLSIDDRKQI